MKLYCISKLNPYRDMVMYEDKLLEVGQQYEVVKKDDVYSKVYYGNGEWNLYPSVLFASKFISHG